MGNGIGPGLFNSTAAQALRYGLSGLSQRTQVITDNVANVDTPGYTARQVDFESVLKGVLVDQQQTTMGVRLRTDNPGHIQPTSDPSFAPPIMGLDLSSAPRNDGNNVDMDQQMTKLAETNVMYDALAQLTSIQLSQTKLAVREGH